MVWNAPHIHLIVNHLPVFASILAIPLLLIALWRRYEKGAFIGAALLLLLAGVGGGVAFFSGREAEESVEDLPGISMRAMSIHEERAEAAAIVTGIVGVMALTAGLMAMKRNGEVAKLWIGVLLAGALVAGGLAGWTALKGGEIRHPEIRPPEVSIDVDD